MDVRAKTKYLKISPRKVIPVVNLIRGKKASKAIEILRFVPKKASFYLINLINSAIANAKNNYALDPDNLYIREITVDMGPSFKRVKFRGRGGRDIIKKRTSHVNIVLSEIEEGIKPKKEVKKITEVTKEVEKPKVFKEEVKVAEIPAAPQKKVEGREEIPKIVRKKEKRRDEIKGFKKWVQASKRFFRRKGG